ncbi:DivIVA domain-containing protein [Micropruina sp.]|uniref:DivIVA domain-containing protein n=1 Tax=Micropruina sp. TaxID=2737536 RepID=UPI0039E25775
MEWVLWMIAVAVLGLAAVAASGRLGELPGTVTDTPRPHVPTGVVTGDDLRALRFAVVPRGYSMDQVDGLLDRLARQLDAAPSRTYLPPLAPDVPPVGAETTTAAPGFTPAETVVSNPETEPPTPRADTDPDPAAPQVPVGSDDERPAFFRPAGENDQRR